MRARTVRLYILLALITAAAMLVAGEVVVLVFSPTEYLSPRYRYSPAYGMTLFKNVVMVHALPRRYKFHYTINQYAYRGEPVAPAAGDSIPIIVVVGDSYSFGMGVDDGEEYPAVADRLLRGRAKVVNLACPGWALTQEIRRYCEFGSTYHPRALVLQFCANDVEANFTNRVTVVRDGELVFRNSDYGANRLKKYLSRSFLQRSQLYNFFRGRVAVMVKDRFVRRNDEVLVPDDRTGMAGTATRTRELAYNELLETFVKRLQREGTPLIIISVDGQLDRHPTVHACVDSLAADGAVTYLEVLDWLKGLDHYESPEGHRWGTKAHAAIGRGLADYLGREVLARDPGAAGAR